MARKKGTNRLGSNLEPQVSANLDARLEVPLKSDLLTIEYPYQGMIVFCKEDQKHYKLNGNSTLAASWTEFGSGGSADHVELTQAEYDALTPEEKNNGKVYFITDGQVPSGGDVFDVYYNETSFADVDKAIKEKKALRFCAKDLGGADITRVFSIVSYTWVPSENKYYLWYVSSGLPTDPENAGHIAYCTIDNTNTWSAVGVFTPEDTGWQTIMGTYIGVVLRKINGIVYGSIIGGLDNATNANYEWSYQITLPEEFRPDYRQIFSCPTRPNMTFEIRPNGEVSFAAEQAHAIQTQVRGSFSYPV